MSALRASILATAVAAILVPLSAPAQTPVAAPAAAEVAPTAPVAAQAPAPATVRPAAKMPTTAEMLAATKPQDWRQPNPDSTIVMSLATGKVVIELNPEFAPRHVANIIKLTKAHWYDGLAVLRVQDNFVAQWGDPLNSRPEVGEKHLPAEFTRPAAELAFARLKDPDVYAPEVGFNGSLAVGRGGSPHDGGDSTPGENEAWPLHCYGAVGVGRDNDPSSAIGTELYAVIGQAPRQLDRNTAIVGRVIFGMEHLSALQRGTGESGFYEQPEQREPIRSVRLASELPSNEKLNLEVLRTDTKTFQKYVETRRNRRDAWYKVPAGRIDVCNVSIPVRERSEDHAEHPDRVERNTPRKKR